MAKHILPYGSWQSPITSDFIVSGTTGFNEVMLDGTDVYWTESRPSEGGRSVLMRRSKDGAVQEMTPAPWNVRTRVHEYGGGAYTVVDGVVIFTHFIDQQLYRIQPGSAPEALINIPQTRYAEPVLDATRNRIICVCEDHRNEGEEAKNSIVAIPLDGSAAVQTLVSGNDFYSNPSLSPDGTHLSWVTWNHPNMPWDGTELYISKLTDDGTLLEPVLIAGGASESIFQPQWSPSGTLYFVSDRTGWWNLYRVAGRDVEAIAPLDAEFGVPQWVFGLSTYGFLSEQELICSYLSNGDDVLAILHTETKRLEALECRYTTANSVRASHGRAAFVGGSATIPSALVTFDASTRTFTEVKSSSSVSVDTSYFSVPESIEFPTSNGLSAYAIYYPPTNPDYEAPQGSRPPLLVLSHGGPTSATTSSFSLSIQYWTSRGIAVVDVNYGGSTGYGRAYRERLKGQWGIVDVQDCANAAKYLVSQGLADGERLAIRGGSAGGYTTLASLTFDDTFHAGASYFGVSDLELLALDTHKFESRYMDSLVGPYPESKPLYESRSPLYHTDQLSCPVIFFQGLDDRVVPPNQAELMVEKLRAKGLPTAYVPYEGEGHGFRKAENIKHSLDSELYFYSKVFGFAAHGIGTPVKIENIENTNA